MKILLSLFIVSLFSCTGLFNEPQITSMDLQAGYVYGLGGPGIAQAGDEIAKCYDNYLIVKTDNVFRYKIFHSCKEGTNTIAPTGYDKIDFCSDGLEWIEVTAWNDDGEKTVKRKYYYAR